MRNDEIRAKLAHHAIQVQQFADPAVPHIGKTAHDTRRRELGSNSDEVVLLRQQRSHADFVSGTLMVNRKTFYEYFCPGQSWCVNQLKNPHDLSL
jgi:hypothetical protein